jgi:hypothetical protein
MTIDPYSSPATYDSSTGYASSANVSQGVINQLAGTKPWVRFMSVLMFIGAGFMLLAALIMLVAGGAVAATTKSSGGALPAGMMSVIAILYAVFSAVYIYPALKLWKYANRIGSLLITGATMDLESALNEQRAFWKFIGIMVIAMFALYFVVVIAAVAIGAFGTMRSH